MERPVAVFFGIVDVVEQTARLLLEVVGECAVDAQADGFVVAVFVGGAEAGAVVDDADDVAVFHVGKVASRLAHALVDAVRAAVAHFGADVQPVVGEDGADAGGESFEAWSVGSNVGIEEGL